MDTGLRIIEIGNGSERIIPIDPKGKFPIVIGRGPDAGIQIGLLGRNTFIRDANGNSVPIAKCISSVQATIYQYANGELRIHDGNGKPSNAGIRIFGCDKPIERPIPLSPGAHVELMPRAKGWACWVEWAPDETDIDGEPTLGFNKWNKRLLEDDKRVLEDRVNELEQNLADKAEIDNAQNRKIKRTEGKIHWIKIFGIVVVSAILISLGVDIEELDYLLKGVAVIAGSGLVWTASEKKD
ncbi:hypothetical protein Lepto7375DRAFT_7305 [Leptolyngbya sp. PCC 7375]|nr:hypothetical protein Lepto7375DRAFT_7305 [Leptolyngbya sp. PCC 7375]